MLAALGQRHLTLVGRHDQAPHLFQTVVTAHLRPEQMDDDVAAIDQHPITDTDAFDTHIVGALLLQQNGEMLGHRRQMALGPAGGDDHEIGDAGFAVEIDDNDVFGLVVIQGSLHQGGQRCFTIEG
jgi:hypothetical protein